MRPKSKMKNLSFKLEKFKDKRFVRKIVSRGMLILQLNSMQKQIKNKKLQFYIKVLENHIRFNGGFVRGCLEMPLKTTISKTVIHKLFVN